MYDSKKQLLALRYLFFCLWQPLSYKHEELTIIAVDVHSCNFTAISSFTSASQGKIQTYKRNFLSDCYLPHFSLARAVPTLLFLSALKQNMRALLVLSQGNFSSVSPNDTTYRR